MRSNPEKVMATLYTYTCQAGKSFPVIRLDRDNGKFTCLAIGNMPLEIPAKQLKLGVVLQAGG